MQDVLVEDKMSFDVLNTSQISSCLL